MQCTVYFKGVCKSLPVTCTGLGSTLLCVVFKYKLYTFKIMTCIISMQIYNSRNIRLGNALGCSHTWPWTGSPVKVLMYVYLFVLKVFRWSRAFPGTPLQCLTVRKSSLAEVQYSGIISCGKTNYALNARFSTYLQLINMSFCGSKQHRFFSLSTEVMFQRSQINSSPLIFPEILCSIWTSQGFTNPKTLFSWNGRYP